MNFIRPYSRKSGIAPRRIPVIFLLLFILLICGLGNSLYAQNDSIEITAVPLTEIATTAASHSQQMRDLMMEEVQVATGFNLIPQIDSLESLVLSLEELTNLIMGSRLANSYYNSLILRWTRVESMASPHTGESSEISEPYAGDRHPL